MVSEEAVRDLKLQGEALQLLVQVLFCPKGPFFILWLSAPPSS